MALVVVDLEDIPPVGVAQADHREWAVLEEMVQMYLTLEQAALLLAELLVMAAAVQIETLLALVAMAL